MPQFIQAKRLGNKLGVRDNRPYAIEKVRFRDSADSAAAPSFLLFLSDEKGEERLLAYNSLNWFMKDFNIVNNLNELEDYKFLERKEEDE